LYFNGVLSFFRIRVLLNVELLITGVHDVTTSTATSQLAPTEAHGATIILFPARKPAAATPVDDRLTVSLANLTAALEEQRAAVTAWRTVLQDLKTTTAGLHDSLQKYSASLGALGDGVSAVRDRARALEQWADKAIASGR
jgi:lipopolysaccharide biosynthesis regulator YciM